MWVLLTAVPTPCTHRVESARIGITYDLTESLALYAAYSTGFRGAFNFTGRETPKPELSRNYEAGVKLAFNDLGICGSSALTDMSWWGQQAASLPRPLLRHPRNYGLVVFGATVHAQAPRRHCIKAFGHVFD
ncbi:TonB-dependent receptor domain-containing protein [Pseudomonas sp. BIGb0381]|uniref:TonB-dependent receptor domain-containing protein n=1 Tax=Pseudomonas sp. BIGb0381 TaxID=2940608 RepID=UPI0021684E43|nr:TonB-dependent receptor [Pseudomonas sp. BIGb0381]